MAHRTCFKQFCGGESLEKSVPVVVLLTKYRVKAILDYSIYTNHTHDQIRKTMEELIRSLEVPACCGDIPFAVFRPSALCPDEILTQLNTSQSLPIQMMREVNNFRERVEDLCWRAYEKKIPIILDAENFIIQDFIDSTVIEMMEKFNRERVTVYNTLQMYRTDRLEYMNNCYSQAEKKGYRLGFKLVRGAYMKKEIETALDFGLSFPIWPNKAGTDMAYNQALAFCISHINRISFVAATHNEESCLYLTELMKENGIANCDPRIYFSQFYGMSDHITFNLAHEGYNVVKYVPYGPAYQMLPYMICRAHENSSFDDHSGRELHTISSELRRRRRN